MEVRTLKLRMHTFALKTKNQTQINGGMTMRLQTKCPWSFQPWTMSLSGQYVPRLKLVNGFYVLSIFCPWTLHPSQYSPFLGTLWPSLIFNFDHYFWSLYPHLSPFATLIDFYRGKYHQNLNFPHIILQKCMPIRFCHILLRKFAAKMCSKRDSHEIINPFALTWQKTVTHFCRFFTVLEYSLIGVKFLLITALPTLCTVKRKIRKFYKLFLYWKIECS